MALNWLHILHLPTLSNAFSQLNLPSNLNGLNKKAIDVSLFVYNKKRCHKLLLCLDIRDIVGNKPSKSIIKLKGSPINAETTS